MDALKSLIANVPDWIKRLDDLSDQIAKRQLELAHVVEPGPSSSSSASPPSRSKSVRNKGSTESLKPNDEDAAWQEEDTAKETLNSQVVTASTTTPNAGEKATVSLQQQATLVAEVPQARLRATLRKRNKRSDSIVTAEGAAPKYRTRSMIIVYYDSYVQSFFEELVKFVSAQRNLMRKAKMAAKVAQIKRMAELEMPDTDEDDAVIAAATVESPKVVNMDPGAKLVVDSEAPIEAAPRPDAATKPRQGDDLIIAAASPSTPDEIPALNYRRTLNMRSPGMLASGRPMYLRASGRSGYVGSGAGGSYMSASQQPPDVYDELDKGLEYVQSMCEHAAHQFLRDGDCNEEVENVKRRLGETREQADREMERVKKEDPDALKASEEPPKMRSFRPQSMRKETPSTTSAGAKDALSGTGAISVTRDPQAALEVDEGIDDMDTDMPKLMYKSSRLR